MEEVVQSHINALRELYQRIAEAASDMGGAAAEVNVPRRLAANAAGTRHQTVPALIVSLPDSFHIEFGPSNALGSGNMLSVRARRLHHGAPRSDWTFNLVQGDWQYSNQHLSNDAIRKCLMPEDPKPLVSLG